MLVARRLSFAVGRKGSSIASKSAVLSRRERACVRAYYKSEIGRPRGLHSTACVRQQFFLLAFHPERGWERIVYFCPSAKHMVSTISVRLKTLVCNPHFYVQLTNFRRALRAHIIR